MNTVQEEWRPVKDWEDVYEVSNHGNVRGVPRSFTRIRRGKKEITVVGYRIKKISTNHDGYAITGLTIGSGRALSKLVHRLVATAFIGPVPEGMEVNHRDGNKLNNHIENIEYVTHLENMRHADRTGLRTYLPGEKNGMAILTENQVRDAIALFGTMSVRQIANKMNCKPHVIYHIRSGKNWKHIPRESA